MRWELVIALGALIATGCETCPRHCPVASASIAMTVTAAPNGGAVPGAEIALSGPTTGAMDCEASTTETVCWWMAGPIAAGDYVLQVTAPGFEPAHVDAVLKIDPDPGCGCASASFTPSEVSLSPM